jgi:acyl-CoA synthetase (AMP-forming)/AMP-acid ligase II
MIDASCLWRLLASRAEAAPEALFAVDDRERTLSFAQYHDAALRAAAGLAAGGVAAGDVVSWQLPTSLESLILAAALARLGAVQNPILPIYREREVGFAVRQAGAKRLVVPSTFRGFDHGAMARALAGETPGLQPLLVDDVLPAGEPATLPPFAAPGPATTRWIFYTSGTTSDPKGARHSDATLMAVGRALHERLGLASDDRIALVFPVTHVGGVGWLLAGLLAGCAQIVVPSFGPDAIRVLARHGVTQGTAGTAFHQAYLAAQREHGAEPLFPRIRSFPGGGAPKPPGLHFDVKRELGGAGIVSGYGLTECPIATMGSPDDPDERLAETEGRASAGVEIRIAEDGEIRLKGPQLCQGYLDASLDAEAFDDEGFFRTGDLGYLSEDGYLVVTGRSKDVIIRKGENISAKEIEDLLHEHPKVLEAAVIGLPDPASGERACAVVACRDEADPLGFEEMVAFLRERQLMVQKLPEQLERLPALPRNPTGKILKQALRKRFGG